MVKKYLVEIGDSGNYDLWDSHCAFGEPEISFDFPEQLVSKIKEYIDKYDQIQRNLRELIRIGFWEKVSYEKEQIEEYIIKFNKMFGSE